MPTAQEIYTSMLSKQLSPALRAAGWTGSAGRYQLPSDSHWVLIGVQKFTWSTAVSVDFTVNCTVANRQAWQLMTDRYPYLGAKPSPTTVGARSGPWSMPWRRRLGHIAPDSVATGWTLHATDTTEGARAVADQVVDAISTYALPEMLTQVALLGPALTNESHDQPALPDLTSRRSVTGRLLAVQSRPPR